MIILAAIFAALTVFIGVYALITPGRPREVTVRLGQFDRQTAVTDREALLATPFATRVGNALATRGRQVFGRFLPTAWTSAIEHRLVLAGEPISLHAFIAIQAVAAALMGLSLFMGLPQASGMLGYGAVIAASGILGVAPLLWLRSKVKKRQRAIVRALPDAVDLIVTTVEAGMSIDGAIAEVGRETEGPLGEEFRLAIRETTLGSRRRDALERLVQRTEVPELKTFIQAIIQAEQTGIPIGQVLRTQADQIRLKRRQRAESDAQRAPVKMIVVLVLLVLPSMLLMIMGPALIRMGERL